MGGPFDANKLNQLIGGSVRLYNNQSGLLKYTCGLQDAMRLKKDAGLLLDNEMPFLNMDSANRYSVGSKA